MLTGWTYEGVKENEDGEPLMVVCEPALAGKGERRWNGERERTCITITVGNTSVWLTPSQMHELAHVLHAMKSADATLR
jgi:predicted transglutaminase-like cysteine proteinase